MQYIIYNGEYVTIHPEKLSLYSCAGGMKCGSARFANGHCFFAHNPPHNHNKMWHPSGYVIKVSPSRIYQVDDASISIFHECQHKICTESFCYRLHKMDNKKQEITPRNLFNTKCFKILLDDVEESFQTPPSSVATNKTIEFEKIDEMSESKQMIELIVEETVGKKRKEIVVIDEQLKDIDAKFARLKQELIDTTNKKQDLREQREQIKVSIKQIKKTKDELNISLNL